MWHRAIFTIPVETSKDKLMASVPRYIERWIRIREKEGWRLISRIRFKPFGTLVPNDPERMRYELWAQFERAPVTQTIEVPDSEAIIKKLVKKYGAKVKD